MNKTVIFDLDGTLVDIEPVFLKLYNRLAEEFHLEPITEEEIALHKDLPLKKFILKRLGWRIFLFPKLLKLGRAAYFEGIKEVQLFPGMKEVCETLHAHGYHLGIISSSEERVIRTIIERYTLPVEFLKHSGLFTKAKTLKKLLHEKHLPPHEVIYVGDELRDVEACEKVGISIIAVTWGLNSKAALQKTGVRTADTREELLASLLQ